MDRSISRRLDALQRFADENKPCKVVVTFTDGSSTTTDSAGAIDLFRELGAHGKIDSFQADGPMSEWARLVTILLHPAPDREVSDFE